MGSCKVFLDKSVEARKSFIKKSGFCFICLGDVRVIKAHVGGKCPNFDHNVCKSCNEKPPHHPLLCQRSRANNHGSPRRGGVVEVHLALPHHHPHLAEEAVVEEGDVLAEGHTGVTVVKHLVDVWWGHMGYH